MKKKEATQQPLDAVTAEEYVAVETLDEPNLSVGVTLANARKDQDKSIEEIAQALNLSSATIRTLETDQTDGLPELTYVRGYIRSYTRLLGLDPEQLVTAYSNVGIRVSYDEIPQGLSEEDFQVSNGRSRWVKWLVILVVLAALIFWFAPNSIKSLSSDNNEPSVPARVVSNTGQPSSSAPIGSSEELLSDSLLSEQNQQQDAAQTEVGESDEQSTVIEVPENVLVLSFAATRWLDVRDSDNNRLAYNSVAGGNEVVLSSDLTMSVYIDNVDGVSATLNGEPYDLSQFRQGAYAQFNVEAPE